MALFKGVSRMEGYTQKFDIVRRDMEIREIVKAVYKSLVEKGYNPVNQLVGYILSEDPTYITNHNNARTLITRIDRDELLRELVLHYLKGDAAQ